MVVEPPPIPPSLLQGLGTTFVGRSRERRQFGEVWDLVAAGHRQVVFVGGEPGAGKSRLVAEVARACFDDGAIVLLGSNTRDRGYALQPFVEMLDQLFVDARTSVPEALPEETVSALARLSPRLSEQWSGSVTTPALDEPGELFGAVAELFRSLARIHPVLLVLENLHWAGTYTRQLLSRLVQESGNERLMIIGTHRTTAPDRSDELTLSIAELYGLPGVARIDLAGLETDDILHYLVAATGTQDPEARQAAAVLRDQTGGNPFFLEEVWRELEQQDGLRTVAARALKAPRTIRDMLELRLRALAPETLAVLERAAIAGDRVDTGLLMATGLPVDQVLSAVDHGVEFGFLAEAEGQEVVFRHSLSRQAVIDRMPRGSQIAAHAEVALALERERRRTPDTLAALAHHYTEAAPLGYGTKAAEYLAHSARASRASLAHEEAAAAFAHAALMAEPEAPIELLFEEATSLGHAGRMADARSRYRALAATDDPIQLARAAIGFEEAAWEQNADPEASMELLARALRILEPGSPLYVLTTASLGRALLVAGSIDESRRLAEEALALARSTGDPELVAHALMGLIHHLGDPHELGTQLERADELTNLARSSGHQMRLAMGVGAGANAAYRLGMVEEFRERVTLADRIVTASGQPFVALSGGCLAFSVAYLGGRFGEAREVAEKLLAEGSAFGEGNAQGVYGMQMFAVQRATGALAELPRHVVMATATADRWQPGLLAVYTEIDAREEVERLLPGAVHSLEELPPVSAQWAALAVFLVEAISYLGDQVAAERVWPVLEPCAGTNLMAGHLVLPFGSADRYLAILDHVLNRSSAADHFERALDMDRRMGSVVHESETLLSYAAHLDQIGKTVQAAEARRRGTAIAKEIGLRRRLPLEGGRQDIVDLRGPDGLSPRETDVLRLLALGMGNREIGEKLMISANTAANHVRSILMKTGSANRTQAAVYATNHGLV